jgi:hypothetical protein
MIFKNAIAKAIQTGDRLRESLLSATSLALPVALVASFGAAQKAEALPSFARQTGQTCSTCHTAYLQLTPFGRRFKLNGYISEGGGLYGASGSEEAPFTPALPLAFLTQAGYTHYNKGIDPALIPVPNGGFTDRNNMLNLAQQSSVFYGGRIFDNFGAFIQTSYTQGYNRTFSVDNADIRYTQSFAIGNVDVIWGVTVNNRPTVQDVWNTVPAWTTPFLDSVVLPIAPAAGAMLELIGPSEMVGSGSYVFINNMIYAEVAAYGSLSPRAQTTLGISPPPLLFTLDGLAPYWRLAIEPNWGEHSLMIGTYGMTAKVLPPPRMFGVGTDKYTDIGFDTQYQWLTDEHAVTFRGNYIWEQQKRNASFALAAPLTGNPVSYLRSLKLSGEYVYDHMYSFTATYFYLNGSRDAVLWIGNNGMSPNTSGWTFDAAYLPYMRGGPKFWPWLNTRLGVAYTMYNTFDGGVTNLNLGAAGRNARDNSYMFAYLWTVW